MDDLLWIIVVSLSLGFLPPLVGYGRRLDDWTMMRIWLWLLLPALGWCVSLALAISEPRRG